MANYKVTDTELTSVANAIRTKGATQASLEFPTGFVTAIENIPTGHEPVLQSKTATENGTVTPDQGYDGLSSVVVNVSGGGGGSQGSISVESDTLISENVTISKQPVITNGKIAASSSNYLQYKLDKTVEIEFDYTIVEGSNYAIFCSSNNYVFRLSTTNFSYYNQGTRISASVALNYGVQYRVKLKLYGTTAELYVDGTLAASGQYASISNAIDQICNIQTLTMLYDLYLSTANSSLMDNIEIRIYA